MPTLAEAGVTGVEITGWIGVMVPRGTPQSVTATLHKDIAAILQVPDVKQRLVATGADPVGSTPEQFRAFPINLLGNTNNSFTGVNPRRHTRNWGRRVWC